MNPASDEAWDEVWVAWASAPAAVRDKYEIDESIDALVPAPRRQAGQEAVADAVPSGAEGMGGVLVPALPPATTLDVHAVLSSEQVLGSDPFEQGGTFGDLPVDGPALRQLYAQQMWNPKADAKKFESVVGSIAVGGVVIPDRMRYPTRARHPDDKPLRGAHADAAEWKDLLQLRLNTWASTIAKASEVSQKVIVIACEVSSSALVGEDERAIVYAHLASASALAGRMPPRQNWILCQPRSPLREEPDYSNLEFVYSRHTFIHTTKAGFSDTDCGMLKHLGESAFCAEVVLAVQRGFLKRLRVFHLTVEQKEGDIFVCSGASSVIDCRQSGGEGEPPFRMQPWVQPWPYLLLSPMPTKTPRRIGSVTLLNIRVGGRRAPGRSVNVKKRMKAMGVAAAPLLILSKR